MSVFLILATLAVATVDANALMKQSDARHRVPFEVVKASMVLQAQGGAAERRTYESSIAQPSTEKSDKAVIRFKTPADIEGTALLTLEGKDDDEQWLYLPSFKKVRRVGTAELSDHFVGTDFVYEDLRRHRVEDYAHTLLREENLDGAPCYVIESIPTNPKVKKETPYSKSQFWMRKDNLFVVKMRHFDKRGRPIRESTISKLAAVNKDAWRADRVEVVDFERKHRTIVEVTSRTLPASLSDNVFSPHKLGNE